MSRKIAALLAGLALSGTLTLSLGSIVRNSGGAATDGTRVTSVEFRHGPTTMGQNW